MTHPNNYLLSNKQVAALDRALEIAWHRRLQIGMMDVHCMMKAQQILTQRIINSTTLAENRYKD